VIERAIAAPEAHAVTEPEPLPAPPVEVAEAPRGPVSRVHSAIKEANEEDKEEAKEKVADVKEEAAKKKAEVKEEVVENVTDAKEPVVPGPATPKMPNLEYAAPSLV
jgi:hypothetical protein